MSDKQFDEIILLALKEDIRNGDITTQAVASIKNKAVGIFLAKQSGIIAGLEIAQRVFYLLDKSLIFTKFFNDGDKIVKNTFLAEIKGSASSILTAERTALNFLQRMSGIASAANKFQNLINHTKAKIIDTRKTSPALRYFDKLAVKLGGCQNHRIGLFDLFLIKDNHIQIAGSVKEAVKRCRYYIKKNKLNFDIEVEVSNLSELTEALSCSVDIIMLDNFSVEMISKAVKIINGKCKIEASGGVNLKNVKQIAETGVDYISVGALTHSVQALDISLDIKIL